MSLAALLIVVAFVLLMIGIYGLLIIHNMIKIVIAIQIMVKGAMLCFVAAGSLTGQTSLGQSLAVTTVTADTVVAIIGLALAIRIQHRTGTLDVNEVINLEG